MVPSQCGQKRERKKFARLYLNGQNFDVVAHACHPVTEGSQNGRTMIQSCLDKNQDPISKLIKDKCLEVGSSGRM
jgi:hypothetical protein